MVKAIGGAIRVTRMAKLSACLPLPAHFDSAYAAGTPSNKAKPVETDALNRLLTNDAENALCQSEV